MVFDASSKTGKKGISLNDCLHVGPSLNPLHYDILLRFQMAGVAMTADIEKSFLNIEVDKADRDSLRFYGLQIHLMTIRQSKRTGSVGLSVGSTVCLSCSTER